MTEIVPAILTDSPDELVRLTHIFERAGVKRLHLDICDGQFVPQRTITGYDELKRLTCKVMFDVHLMVQHPEQACANWCEVGCADRFFIHVEATEQLAMLCEHAKSCNPPDSRAGKTIGAAINPDTPLEKLEAIAGATNLFQFLTVHPGAQGRTFVPDVLEKMKTFRAAHPDAVIAVDGGINPNTAPQCIAAGANVLVVGSYLVKASDPIAALKLLQQKAGR